jgi:hypothetical protein
LQEYFTLSALIRHGYDNIVCTIIDVVYPNIDHSVPQISAAERQEFIHRPPSDSDQATYQRFATEQLNRLKELIGEHLSLYPERNISFGLGIEHDAYKYIHKIQNPDIPEKPDPERPEDARGLSNVISMVDPCSQYPPQTDITCFYKNFVSRADGNAQFFYPWSEPENIYGAFNLSIQIADRQHLAKPTPKERPELMENFSADRRPGSCIWVTFYDLIKLALAPRGIAYSLYDKMTAKPYIEKFNPREISVPKFINTAYGNFFQEMPFIAQQRWTSCIKV